MTLREKATGCFKDVKLDILRRNPTDDPHFSCPTCCTYRVSEKGMEEVLSNIESALREVREETIRECAKIAHRHGGVMWKSGGMVPQSECEHEILALLEEK